MIFRETSLIFVKTKVLSERTLMRNDAQGFLWHSFCIESYNYVLFKFTHSFNQSHSSRNQPEFFPTSRWQEWSIGQGIFWQTIILVQTLFYYLLILKLVDECAFVW
jgi:hypothetical protein